ncbi:MAG: ABC transporter ATP-binding protein [Saprospiraceae bacterium]|nr:ABC transporter ATP-binding protein [Saprospiraceae bacterium]
MSYFVGQGLTAGYGDTEIYAALSFSLEKGETLAILGRSGCGKTTLLKTLAGLHPASAGEVILNGEVLTGREPGRRGILYLYQEPLLFPHLNVFENVAFGLRLRRIVEAEVRTRTNALLEKLELGPPARQMPEQLSGGQKQRVAFGRALNVQPPVLLLDEPFGNLDVETRANMQQLFKTIAREQHISAIFVTHDLKEAVLMGDRLAYMESGQLSTYADLDAFVADPRTGMSREMDFWQTIHLKNAPTDRL